MTDEVIMMVGIAGSGKSTWASNYENELIEDGWTTAIISRDQVRFDMLKDGEDYFAHEEEVFEEFIRQINECIETGINKVIIDATHLSKNARRKVLRRLVHDSSTDLTFVTIECPVEVALERNAKRTGRANVPEGAIRQMARVLKTPSMDEFPEDNYGFHTIAFWKRGV